MSDRNSTRRTVLGTTAAGLTTLALSGSISTAQQPSPSSSPAPRDPRTKYRKEPFAEQKQPWPALASKMDPPPDHGEQSYKGSGRLAGRKALITGGDSGIGRAAAIAYAREGADVAINYFPTEEPDAKDVVELIKAAGRKAVALPADIRTLEACEKLVAVSGLGGLDILVNNAAYQQSKKDISEITTWRNSARTRRSAGPASRRSWRPCT